MLPPMASVKGLFVAGAVAGGTIVASAYQAYVFRKPKKGPLIWKTYARNTMKNVVWFTFLEAFGVLPAAYALLYFRGAPRAPSREEALA